MKISELIEQLEDLKEKHGDLPVCIRESDEWFGFPYIEVETTKAILNEEVVNEVTSEEEIQNFIALDYE